MELRSSATSIAAVSSCIMERREISSVNGGNRHQQKTLPAFKIPYSLFPVMGEALCHHLLSPGTPLQHLQLLVPTFQFAPLQRIPDLVSQTLTAT